MDFGYSAEVVLMQKRLQTFMDENVLPAHSEWTRLSESGIFPLSLMEDLKVKAQQLGFWNLFLPGLISDEPGTRLCNLDYAPLAEIMGRVPWSAEVFNCNAPDTGNMELLHLFATPAQQEQWVRWSIGA